MRTESTMEYYGLNLGERLLSYDRERIDQRCHDIWNSIFSELDCILEGDDAAIIAGMAARKCRKALGRKRAVWAHEGYEYA